MAEVKSDFSLTAGNPCVHEYINAVRRIGEEVDLAAVWEYTPVLVGNFILSSFG